MAWMRSEFDPRWVHNMSKNKKSIERIAVFGASTTFGFVDTSGKGGWAGRLKRWFEAKEPGDNALFNLGISGATTEHLLDRIKMEAKLREP